MSSHPAKDPMHGVTLEMLLNHLVAHFGWPGLAQRVAINCFKNDPSIKSSLKFLRRTPWARAEVEALYLTMLADVEAAEPPRAADDPWGNWRG